MLIKSTERLEITSKAHYTNRRQLMAGATAMAGMGLLGISPAMASLNYQKGQPPAGEKLTPLDKVTTYNNYYEFGVEKEEPAVYAGKLKTRPWSVQITGQCDKPGNYALEDILKTRSLEERIYRHRCVEGWSMVIPWVGFSLADLLKSAEPNSKAKYVAFETLYRPEEMIGQNVSVLVWPYREGLRIDEAMHPLATLAVGLYGDILPNQNGAPLRLVVPWKYGFKSIKAITKISFEERQPVTAWNIANPKEYGFYSNVNPAVDHPRWSQGKERRIGEFFKRTTLPFNGYGEQVASLYTGMDLQANY